VNHLERILATTRQEVGRRASAIPMHDVQQACAARAADDDERDFAGALARPGMSVIAEYKRRSPSAGAIRDGASVTEIVSAYERGGAAALSVLTEGPNFGGSLADLIAAHAASGLPILRKDFVVEPYQVYESFASGADAVLLIVAALAEPSLAELQALARRLGLAVLVEVHDAAELEVAVRIGAEIVGINNRDLTTLAVDTRRSVELRDSVPAGTLVVAESGFSRPDEVAALAAAGIDAVLIGEALMRAPDVEAACRGLARL
jgi:indole-3-glycerol phosphate synthase